MPVEFTVTDEEFEDVDCSIVPRQVAIRLLLSSKGIKFEDDGKPSLIINLKPIGITVF